MTKLAAISLLALAACTASLAPEVAANQAALPPADTHDRVVEALLKGSEAQAARDAKSLDRSQRLLVSAGARPEEGTPDLAAAWQADAERIAGKPFPEPPPVRGRVLGSAYRTATLAAGATLTLEQIFMAGQKAKVSLVPGAKSQLGFAISEGSADPVCAKDVAGAPASCSWLPIWTTRYKIAISNKSKRPAPVYVVVN